MKKLIAAFLALMICFAAVGCDEGKKKPAENIASSVESTDAASEEVSSGVTETTETTETTAETDSPDEPSDGTSSPLLYKVTDDEGNVVWLFGSIHVGRDDYYPLPDYVMDAFSGSDALAVEVDIVAFENDMSAQVSALMPLVYTDGSTISAKLPEEVYNDAVAILTENGYYNQMLDLYKPVFWSSLIDSILYIKAGADAEKGVDRHLIDLASATGKEIREVESAEEQYAMMGGFSDELQVLLLESSVEAYNDFENTKTELFHLMDLWASGDEAAFSAFLNEAEDVDSDEVELYEEYVTAMDTDRNENMADYAEDALASGDEVFICVGAAHVVGEGAMAEEMAQRGYTVELVG